MEKFLLIVREDLKRIGQFTAEERFARSPDMLPWLKTLNDSGQYIMGQPLFVSGKYVTQDEVQSDGPFIEAKEGISGFDLIWAENIEQAVSIAQSCPMVMAGFAVREVRQLVKMD
ncbi:MAG: YciI family protein [Chryseolinea sp.]